MSLLVPIPWQRYYLVRPEFLALLVRASQRRGHDLYLYHDDPRGLLSGWRSHAMQAQVYDGYLHHGGPTASSPDTGERPHMRGIAGDLLETDAATQAACRAVGLVREPTEAWHWQLPGWFNYPIIPTLAASGLGSVRISAEKKGTADMAILYQNSSTKQFAIAGSSPGTPANWKLWSAASANLYLAQVGGTTAVVLDPKFWDEYQADYLAPIKTAPAP